MQGQGQRYGLEPEDDATEYSESLVMNITDEDVVFKIATTPGSKARRYRLAGFGRTMSSVHLQDGYTKPYKGAGREMIRPIIEKITMREVYPGGPPLPMVVHEDEAPQARARWLASLKQREIDKQAPVTVSLKLDPDTLRPTRAEVGKAPSKPPVQLEEVAQDEIEPPHPDDEDVIADGPPPVDVTAPAPDDAEVPMRKPRSRG